MQPTNITLIAVSSSNKEAFYSTPTEPVRQSEVRKYIDGRLYYCHGKEIIFLPQIFQPKTN